MSKHFDDCLRRFELPEFRKEWARINRGIEKESLRITRSGQIADSAHPAALGSALTNPYITTDFSEALMEFITPVSSDIDECLDFLEAIHQYTCTHMSEDELLWVFSMPCPTGDESKIPLARYGDSNIGLLKTLYRRGLSHRYGSLMQTIAGIHYNFSMPDEFWSALQKIHRNQDSGTAFRTDRYLHLIRNFHRFSWMLFYLFGASPITCKCFARGRDHQLQEYDDSSLFLPHATCLRMSSLGYRSEAQASLFVCYNELDSYTNSLNTALHTPWEAYQKIGMGSNGDHLQINTNLLQLENEFYSTVRPKRVTLPGERPITALNRAGVEYVEVRALDLNPFLPLGIDRDQTRFLDAFLLYCLLADSPNCDQQEHIEIQNNLETVITRGREPDLVLTRQGQSISMQSWSEELLDDIEHAACLLDLASREQEFGSHHRQAVEAQLEKVKDADRTPSARILNHMAQNGQTFFEFAMDLAEQHQQSFTAPRKLNGYEDRLQEASDTSLRRQQEIEAADTIDFDTFLQQWNSF